MGLGWRNRPALAAEQIGERGRRTSIRHMNHVDTGHDFEKLAGDMLRGPIAGGRHVDLARVGLGIDDELKNRFYWKGSIHQHYERLAHNVRDRRNVPAIRELQYLARKKTTG
jgi:hypothetical protein